MSKPIFTGAGIAIVTPFKEDLSIDYDLFEKHIDFLAENKADALIIAGTTGEAPSLSFEEKMELVAVAKKKSSGGLKIIAGAGANTTKEVLKLCGGYEKIGVDGIMVVTPYYNKPSMKGLISHYTEIANSVNTEIMLYNVPSRTSVNMNAHVVSELAKHPNITCIKESSGDFSQIALIAEKTRNVDNFFIYAGNDDEITAARALGAVGVVSVVGNIFPEVIHNMFSSTVENSLPLQLDILEITRAVFSEPSPAPIKAALTSKGLSSNYLRPPMYEMENKEAILSLLT